MRENRHGNIERISRMGSQFDGIEWAVDKEGNIKEQERRRRS